MIIFAVRVYTIPIKFRSTYDDCSVVRSDIDILVLTKEPQFPSSLTG